MSASSRRRATAMRNVRTTPRPKRSLVLRVIILASIVTLVLLTGSAGGAFAYFSSLKVPKADPNSFFASQNSVILDTNHHVLYQSSDRVQGFSRILKPLELNANSRKECPQGKKTKLKSFYYTWKPYRVQYLTCNGWGIPAKLANATIATEDPTFYSNPGFDPLSIVRAAFQDLTSGEIQSGASTIAQQIAKKFVLKDSSPTLSRKAEELVAAYRLTQRFPKRFILYLYLNSVFYGYHSVGVQAAALNFFHRDVSKLKLWQDSMIAGLPQSPSVYNPFAYSNITASKNQQYPPWYTRMTEVLNFLQTRGYISTRLERLAERQAAHYRFRAHIFGRIKDYDFVTYVQDQIAEMTDPSSGPRIFDPYLTKALGGKALNTGLKIFTTLHPALEQVAQSDVSDQIAQLDNSVDYVSDGALVSINLRKRCLGCIMAMVGNGGHDTGSLDINMADTPRQPGSSFKVFNYVSAFEKGLSPASTVIDAPINIPDIAEPTGYYSPANYSLSYPSPDGNIRFALDNSLNVPAVETEVWNTPSAVAHTAFKFGINSFWKDNPDCCRGDWATTLGGLGRGVRLVEETAAYGGFATGGRRVFPISFSKIVNRTTGQVIWKRSQDPWLKHQDHVRVAPAANTYQITSILSDDVTREAEFGPPGYDPLGLSVPSTGAFFNSAAKTGTTSDFKDNWTEGYTRQVVTGVWVGNANDRAMGYGVNGITGAAPIWHNFMESAIGVLHLGNVPFVPPAGMLTSASCTYWPVTSDYAITGYQVLADPDPQSGTDAPTFAPGQAPYCSVPLVPGLDDSMRPVAQPTSIPTTQPVTVPTNLPSLQG